jgi:colicin import membrane protein
MPAAIERFDFAPPQTTGMVRSLGLAILAHALLLAALTWGINWKSSPSVVVAEAELWSAVPQQAAPKLEEPPPAPRVAPAPPPKAIPVIPDASIALEREKKRLKKEQQELLDKLEKQKLQKEKLAQQKREEKKQADLDKRKAALKAAEDTKKLEAQRQANIARATGLANATGAATATGSAEQSSGPSAGYAGRIQARIKSNTAFTDSSAGNPTVVVIVRASPNGMITSRRIVTPSSNKAWDDAVLRAIDKMESIPLDTDGKIPGVLLRDGLELTVSLF